MPGIVPTNGRAGMALGEREREGGGREGGREGGKERRESERGKRGGGRERERWKGGRSLCHSSTVARVCPPALTQFVSVPVVCHRRYT